MTFSLYSLGVSSGIRTHKYPVHSRACIPFQHTHHEDIGCVFYRRAFTIGEDNPCTYVSSERVDSNHRLLASKASRLTAALRSDNVFPNSCLPLPPVQSGCGSTAAVSFGVSGLEHYAYYKPLFGACQISVELESTSLAALRAFQVAFVFSY